MKIKFSKKLNFEDISINPINNTHPNLDTKLTKLIIWILLNLNEDLKNLMVDIE